MTETYSNTSIMQHTATVYDIQRYFEIRLESFINVDSKDSGSHQQCIIVIVIIVIVVFITVPVVAIIIIIIIIIRYGCLLSQAFSSRYFS